MYKKNLYNQIDSSLHNKRGLLINLYEEGNFLNLTNLWYRGSKHSAKFDREQVVKVW